MEGGVHFVGGLGEEFEDGGAVVEFEDFDEGFDFDAAGHFIVKAFPDEGLGDLGLKFVLVGVGVVEDFLVVLFVAGVDVNLVAGEVVADDGVDADAVGYAEGFADPVVAYRGVAGVKAVVVFAVLDEFGPELLAALVAGLAVIRACIRDGCRCSSIFLYLGIIQSFGDVAQDVQGFCRGDIEELPVCTYAEVSKAVDGLVDQALHLRVLDRLEGCIDFERQRHGGVIQLFRADIYWP